MAKTERVNSEKNLISRRTLLSNSLATGVSIAAGFYLMNPAKFPFIKANGSGFKDGHNNNVKKSKEKTYLDNFDC
jgi:hypothetical protein